MDSSATVTERIIERFGGIRPMAGKLDTPVTTVQGWKKRGIIPQSRHADILAAAEREAIAITPEELAETDPGPGKGPEPRAAELVADPLAPSAALPTMTPTAIRMRRSWAGAAALVISTTLLVISTTLFVVLLAGGFAGWRYYIEPLRARVAALELRDIGIEGLERRLARLEAEAASRAPEAAGQPAAASGAGQVAALEQQLAEIRATASDTEQLAKRLSDLQVAAGGHELLAQSIRDIQSSSAATQGELERVKTQMVQLGTRLDQVDAALSDKRRQTLKAEAVVLAVGQLRAALRESRPFVKEISAVRALVEGDTEMLALVDQIQPFAEEGAATIDDLSQEFSRLAPDIVRSAVIGDGQSWWRQALYHLESAISVRRVGSQVPGDRVDAIVARAEAKLQEDDVAGAVAALQTLNGVPAETAAPWIHDANRRIAVDAAESDMTRLAIGHVGSGTPPGSAPAPVPATQ